jgi:hypothetical protein
MNSQDDLDVRDTLLLAGGAALVLFGTGVLLAHPAARRALLGKLTPMLSGQDGAKSSLAGVLPDVERYLKLRAM